MGVLKVVGFGPGSKDDMSIRAVKAIEDADLVMGYTTYVRILKEIFPDKEFKSTGMTHEVDRCKAALEEAKDKTVALVSSGDSGIYGMASITYQVASEMGSDVKIEVIPGITAASSAASLLGAPLTHDTALISLSNCLTPWDVIVKRLDAVSSADMVIALYNPGAMHVPTCFQKPSASCPNTNPRQHLSVSQGILEGPIKNHGARHSENSIVRASICSAH